MAYAINQNGIPVEIFPGIPFTDANGLQHAPNALDAYSASDRARYGILSAPEPNVPANKEIDTRALVFEGGKLKVSITLKDKASIRRLIPKPILHDRLKGSGKLQDAWTILQSDPDIMGRWLMPGHANVYFDDPDLLAVLTAIGADIASITAPVDA